jgi:hypothetical protein
LVPATILDPQPIFPPPIFNYFLTVTDSVMWAALSDETSGLYFSVLSGNRQRSFPQVSSLALLITSKHGPYIIHHFFVAVQLLLSGDIRKYIVALAGIGTDLSENTIPVLLFIGP